MLCDSPYLMTLAEQTGRLPWMSTPAPYSGPAIAHDCAKSIIHFSRSLALASFVLCLNSLSRSIRRNSFHLRIWSVPEGHFELNLKLKLYICSIKLSLVGIFHGSRLVKYSCPPLFNEFLSLGDPSGL